MTRDVVEAELVPQEQQEDIQAVSLYGSMSVTQLEKATKKMAEQRAVITKYVSEQLIDGTDFGKIHVKKDCPDKYNCKNSYHYSKPVLFKPGQEKIFSLFSLTAKCFRDNETLEMLGQADGLIALVCKVYRNGKEIAEGRGAAKIGENSRDANATIKIAEKRARMDACLSLGFSEFFTQDLEDPEYRSVDNTPSQPQTERLATDKQKELIRKKLEEQGVDDEDMKGVLTIDYGVTDTSKLSMKDASMIIEDLISQKGNYVAHTPRGN